MTDKDSNSLKMKIKRKTTTLEVMSKEKDVMDGVLPTNSCDITLLETTTKIEPEIELNKEADPDIDVITPSNSKSMDAKIEQKEEKTASKECQQLNSKKSTFGGNNETKKKSPKKSNPKNNKQLNGKRKDEDDKGKDGSSPAKSGDGSCKKRAKKETSSSSSSGVSETKKVKKGSSEGSTSNISDMTLCTPNTKATITEPECLGPCDPGTNINLDGIVWLETTTGMLVVNVTWRGRTYVGTLLDSSQHEFAPPTPAHHRNENNKRRRKTNANAKKKNGLTVQEPQPKRPAPSNPTVLPVCCPHPTCCKRFVSVLAMKWHHNECHNTRQSELPETNGSSVTGTGSSSSSVDNSDAVFKVPAEKKPISKKVTATTKKIPPASSTASFASSKQEITPQGIDGATKLKEVKIEIPKSEPAGHIEIKSPTSPTLNSLTSSNSTVSKDSIRPLSSHVSSQLPSPNSFPSGFPLPRPPHMWPGFYPDFPLSPQKLFELEQQHQRLIEGMSMSSSPFPFYPGHLESLGFHGLPPFPHFPK